MCCFSLNFKKARARQNIDEDQPISQPTKNLTQNELQNIRMSRANISHPIEQIIGYLNQNASTRSFYRNLNYLNIQN